VDCGLIVSPSSATGVINLPDDDGSWMAEPGHDDDSDSDEIMSPSPPEEAADGIESGEPAGSGVGVGPRRSTYWHHPERRRLSGTPVD
jgi:hypothetical protein